MQIVKDESVVECEWSEELFLNRFHFFSEESFEELLCSSGETGCESIFGWMKEKQFCS